MYNVWFSVAISIKKNMKYELVYTWIKVMYWKLNHTSRVVKVRIWDWSRRDDLSIHIWLIDDHIKDQQSDFINRTNDFARV